MSEVPAFRSILETPALREALLGASMAPDCDIDVLRLTGDAKIHIFFHSLPFSQRLLFHSQDDPIALAKALGWQLHLTQDISATTEAGNYPEVKDTFSCRTLVHRNHILAEGMLDLLALSRPESPRFPLVADAARIERAARDLGWELSKEAIQKMTDRLASGTIWVRTLFETIARSQAQGILPSLAEFYQDAWIRPPGQRGLETAFVDSVEMLQDLVEESPELFSLLPLTDLQKSRFQTEDSEGAGSDVLGLALSSILPLALGSQEADPVKKLHESGVIPNSNLVRFFHALLTTQERSYPAFLETFQKREVGKKRRTRKSSPKKKK